LEFQFPIPNSLLPNSFCFRSFFRPYPQLQLNRPDMNHVAIGEPRRSRDRLVLKQGAVLSAKILDHDGVARARDVNPGMTPRHARRIKPDVALRIASDDVVAVVEDEGTLVPEQPEARLAGGGRPLRVPTELDRFGRERVADAVRRPDEPRL